jgi:tetratricopeptide (TPR) repeat protein
LVSFASVAVALGASPPSRAQAQGTPRDSAAIAAALADSLAALGTAEGFAASIEHRHRAIALYRARASRAELGIHLHRLGLAFNVVGQLDSALARFREAAEIRHDLGDRLGEGRSVNNVGLLLDATGHADSALVYLTKARGVFRSIPDTLEEAGTVLNIAGLYQRLGRLDTSLVIHDEASVLAERSGDRGTQADIENNVAAILVELGRRAEALRRARRSLAIAQEVGRTETVAFALMTLGNAFQRGGEPDSSLAYYRRSKVLLDSLGHPLRLSAAVNIASLLGMLRQGDSALAVLRHVARDAAALGDPGLHSTVLSNYGTTFWRTGYLDSAEHYLREALRLKREIGDRRGEAIVNLTFGEVHLEMGRGDSARVYVGRALSWAREAQIPSAESAALGVLTRVHLIEAQILPSPRGAAARLHWDSAYTYATRSAEVDRAAGDSAFLAKSHEAIGTALELGGRAWAAAAYFDTAASLQSRLGRRAGGEFNRLTQAEGESELYELWSRALRAMGAKLGAQNAVFGALAAVERGRARALLDLMRDSIIPVRPGEDLVAEGKRLAAIATRGGAVLVSYLVTKDSLHVTAVRGPRIVVASAGVSRDSLARVVAAFRAALEVRGGPGDNRTLDLEGPGLVARGPGRLPADAWQTTGRTLSRLLLPPRITAAMRGARELVVVPSGIVATVPFAALSDGAGVLLGRRAAIRYAPSLATLEAASSLGARRLSPDARPLIVGNPAMPVVPTSAGDSVALLPLLGAEDEAKAVADEVGGTFLRGAEASETEVRRRLPLASVVHLATHGYAYSSRGLARNSFVALAPGSGHDGLLTVGDILDDRSLRLTADLVVLSACQTGLGDVTEAEGTVGLQRAMLAQGARSVMVSLWSVSDTATRLLMESFYRHWQRDTDRPSKAESLRRAQTDVSRSSAYAHPRYWAAFQLVGVG